MINSPSISLVSAPQKLDKTSAVQSTTDSGDRFGNVFNNTPESTKASEIANTSAKPHLEDHDKAVKSDANQEAANASNGKDEVGGDATDRTDSKSESSSVTEASDSVDHNSESDANITEQKTDNADDRNEAVVSTENNSNSKDGNPLHNDGQNIAGASSELSKDVSDNLTLESGDQGVNKERVSNVTDSEGELSLESLTQEKAAGKDIAAEAESTQNDVEQSDKSEKEQSAAGLLNNQPGELVQKSAELDNVPKSNVEQEQGQQAKPLDSQFKPLDSQSTPFQPSPMSAAQVSSTVVGDGSAEQTPPHAEKAADTVNLKWVMDQLSGIKSERPGAVSNILQGQAESASDLKLTDLANMDEWLESGDIDLSKSFEDVMSAKKPLDQLMANIASQSQSLGAQSLTNPTTVSSFANARGDVPAQLTMQAPPTSPQWAEEMNQKVNWVVREGIKTAHIQLDPPELGSLVVKVTMDQDSNTQISFVASSAQAKDALEGQMQRLREMLQQQGLDLDAVDVEVSQRNDQSGQSGSFGEDGSEEASSGAFASLDGDVDEELENLSYVTPAAQGIDYYA